jgi:hypothetical protein
MSDEPKLCEINPTDRKLAKFAFKHPDGSVERFST